MIAGITASTRRGGAALLAPTDLVATLVEPTPTPLPTVIGEAFGGGFYAGDIEYPDGQWYKLIVADKAADITGAASKWKTSNTDTPSTGHEVDGVSNTASMVAAGIELHPAAAHCIGHHGGGNADWYMPAKDELNVVYQNLGFNRPNCPPDFQSGGPQAFSNAWYWASTQYPPSSGWIQDFSGGTQTYNFKNTTQQRVRPVRRIAFTPEAPALPTTIGEAYGGGYYIGDIVIADGGADDGVYVVIMAGVDAETSLAWKTTDTATVGTDSLTNGLANTLSMQAADPSAHPAGMYCLNYTGDDHDDWYLPARDELNLAWLNRADLGNLGMKSAYYRASTQTNATQARVIWFGNGANVSYLKKESHTIRPVRRIKRY